MNFVFDLHRQLARRREHQHAALGSRAASAAPGRSPAAAAAIGTTNAQVLPVPVSAQAMRSPPASASGITALWIGARFTESRDRGRLRAAAGRGSARRTQSARCRRASGSSAGAWCVGCARRWRRPAASSGTARRSAVARELASIGCIGIQTVFWLACAERDDAPDGIVRARRRRLPDRLEPP